MDDATTKTLLSLAHKCSPGDLSMLEVALAEKGDSRLTTSPGSANFAFWSACAEAGLMVRLDDLVMPLAAGEMRSPTFGIAPEARADMQRLYAAIRQYYDPRSYHMSNIYNEMCWPFIENFYQAVDKGGGQDDDIETLISLMLCRLITRHYPAADSDDRLVRIGLRVRQLLKN